MRLPSRKRPGNPILASDWNLLIDALEARTPRPGPGTEIIAATGGFSFRVRPTAASASASKPVPLHILASRPPYIAATTPPAEESLKRYYIEWGTLNNLVATNWDNHFEVAATTYFFAKATFQSGDAFVVTSWEIVTGPAANSHATAPWPIGSPRPASMVVLLGAVVVADGKHSVSQSGGGSIVISEHVTGIYPGGSSGETSVGKQLTYLRVPY
jgi:hypothetical protein